MRSALTVISLAIAIALAAPGAAVGGPIRYPVESRDRLVIHATGDVMTSPGFIPPFRTGDFTTAWTGVDGIFLRDDLTIVNLECDPSDRGTLLSDKPYSFRCPPESLVPMRSAGVDVVSLGNNHSGDYSAEGLLDGKANVLAAGLQPIGAGANLAEANLAAFFDLGGRRVAVMGFSAVSGIAYDWPFSADDYANLRSRWFATDDGPGIAPATVANMTATIRAVRAEADIVIVMLHQGVDNETLHPFAVEVERAHGAIDAGADVVFAHHHHRVLPLEEYHGRPIFYGLGSFVFPRFDPVRNISAVGEVIVAPDGTITARIVPAYIETSGHPVLRGVPDYQVRADRERIR